jgi:NAD(P)H-hydrate repair Nnr-like enzyme with NAD(P)H-hydrate dehydratase domain
MPNSNDEQKGSTGLDRRAVMRGALAVGGASVLAGTAAAMPAPTLQTVVTEKEWARVLSRVIVSQLPEAVAQVPDIRLTTTQIAELQRAFENTLITNMGCVNG